MNIYDKFHGMDQWEGGRRELKSVKAPRPIVSVPHKFTDQISISSTHAIFRDTKRISNQSRNALVSSRTPIPGDSRQSPKLP